MSENHTLRGIIRSLSSFIGDGLGGIIPKMGFERPNEFMEFINKAETDTAFEGYRRRKQLSASGQGGSQGQGQGGSGVGTGSGSMGMGMNMGMGIGLGMGMGGGGEEGAGFGIGLGPMSDQMLISASPEDDNIERQGVGFPPHPHPLRPHLPRVPAPMKAQGARGHSRCLWPGKWLQTRRDRQKIR